MTTKPPLAAADLQETLDSLHRQARARRQSALAAELQQQSLRLGRRSAARITAMRYAVAACFALAIVLPASATAQDLNYRYSPSCQSNIGDTVNSIGTVLTLR